MSLVFLRRRRLGAGSTAGIIGALTNAQLVPEGETRVVRSWEAGDMASIRAEDVVVRWGCTAAIPTQPRHVSNSAESIHWCADKRAGRLAMQTADVPVPETWASETFRDTMLNLPHDAVVGHFVLRPAAHAQGLRLWSGDATAILAAMRANNLTTGGYVSRLIPKVAEYRVFCMLNRAVWVARKTPGNPDDVAWNVARGGRFDNVRWDEWPKAVIIAALQAAAVSGTEFCGVDVMVDAEGLPYVLEVNSAPSQTSPYRQQCVARALAYHYTQGWNRFPDVEDGPRRTYRSYIHPSLR